jgi:hypothetical protein
VIAIRIPSFDTIIEAMDYVQSRGRIVRLVLEWGSDNRVRGSALVRPSGEGEQP